MRRWCSSVRRVTRVSTLIATAVHGTYMANSWDFYKPALSSEFPEVDGPLTLTAYLTALESTYATFREKEARRLHSAANGSAPAQPHDPKSAVTVDDFDFFCFHGPFGKLVQKAFARLVRLPRSSRAYPAALQRLPEQPERARVRQRRPVVGRAAPAQGAGEQGHREGVRGGV